MEEDNQARFIRWQGITREQFTWVTNIVLGLATGLLAFQSSLLVDGKVAAGYAFGLAIASLGLLTLSVIAALVCAVSRLTDFRKTAQITRPRDGHGDVGDQRAETRALGQLSWGLFWVQLVLFGGGAACGVLAVVCKVWPSV